MGHLRRRCTCWHASREGRSTGAAIGRYSGSFPLFLFSHVLAGLFSGSFPLFAFASELVRVFSGSFPLFFA